jgi:hypothetical protein
MADKNNKSLLAPISDKLSQLVNSCNAHLNDTSWEQEVLAWVINAATAIINNITIISNNKNADLAPLKSNSLFWLKGIKQALENEWENLESALAYLIVNSIPNLPPESPSSPSSSSSSSQQPQSPGSPMDMSDDYPKTPQKTVTTVVVPGYLDPLSSSMINNRMDFIRVMLDLTSEIKDLIEQLSEKADKEKCTTQSLLNVNVKILSQIPMIIGSVMKEKYMYQ